MQKLCMMPDRTDRLFSKSQLGSLIFHHTVAFLLLTHSHRGQSQATGQPQPIVAIVGDDITLPCHVKPATDAVDQMLEWSRPDLNPRFVHVRRFGEDQLVDQNPSYKGRTSASINRLKQGDMSLTLSKVKLSDEGTYRCFSPGLETDSSVKLVVVSESESVTVIEISKVSSGVMLDCRSEGWYAEPEVLWLDGEGSLLSAGPPETVRGPDKLYNVSSRVTVEKRHSNSFTCRVQQKNTNQTAEAHIQVPDDFFTDSSGAKTSTSTIIGLVFGISFILVVAFVVWKWRQNKTKNHVDEETWGGGERKSNSISSDSEQDSLIKRKTDRRDKLTVETETKMKEENSTECLSEETRRSCQIEEETHQEKTEGETNNTPAEVETQPEETKSINTETAALGPAERETQPEETNTERAAEGQMDGDGQQQQVRSGGDVKSDNDKDNEGEEIKSAKSEAAGQDSTDKENNDLDQTGGQTGKTDATPCPTEREGHPDNNRDRKDGVDNTTPLSPADRPSDQLPKAEDKDTKSTNNEPADQGSNEGETKREQLQAAAERNTEDERNTKTEHPSSPITEQPPEKQPEKSPDSGDGEDGKTSRIENTTSDQPPTAQAHSDVENTEEEKEKTEEEKTEEEKEKTEEETHGKQRINGQPEKLLSQADVNEQEQHEEREDRRRTDRNLNVAEEEHHPNAGGDDASYSSGIPDLQPVTGGETDQQQSADDRQKGDGTSV